MRRRLGRSLLALSIALLASAGASAQRVTVDDLVCVALDPHKGRAEHGLVSANVSASIIGDVRLYFRRMSVEVEDFYWLQMVEASAGDYWAVLPDPEDATLVRKDLEESIGSDTAWAQWWRAKEASADRDPNGDLDWSLIEQRAARGQRVRRAWMEDLGDRQLQEWLESLENEPIEYYAALVDDAGTELAVSDLKVAPVQESCIEERLSSEQRQASRKLTVGETAGWQVGKSVFHFGCDHIVARIDPAGSERKDTVCCARCGVFWFALAGGAATAGYLIDDDDPPLVSPSLP